MGRTKDEAFMLKLHEESLKQHKEIEVPLNKYAIGEMIGMQKTAVETITNLLAQANFIRKHGPNEVSITPHGLKLIQGLKGNR